MVVSSILPLSLSSVLVKSPSKAFLGPLSVELGEAGITSVMGPNGAGKTTLLRVMHGLVRPSAGVVRWRVPEVQARSRQAYVFQTPVMMRRRALDSIAYPLLVHGISRRQARIEAEKWAIRLGLGDVLMHPSPLLSGGEKQKLALARALIRDPDVLFLDEPCANLDGRSTREIERTLLSASAQGTRIVMATHDIAQAKRLATEVLFLHEGILCEMTSAMHFFDRPSTAVAQAFLQGDIIE